MTNCKAVVIFCALVLLILSALTVSLRAEKSNRAIETKCVLICGSADVKVKDGRCGCITWHRFDEQPSTSRPQ